MTESEYKALMEIGQRGRIKKTEFIETYAKGKALILDRELRNVKHFSKLGDDEMMKAFDD